MSSKRRKWSDQDLAFLAENKGLLSHEQMADHLGRSVCAIDRKVTELGIAKKRTGSRLKDGTKVCSKCQLPKDADEFANNSTRIDGKECWCKKCRSSSLRESKYGMTEEEYERRLKAQSGRCGICNQEAEVLVVDHCHESGEIRELLCSMCNVGLGNLKEDPAILASAILYLKRYGKRIPTFDGKPLSPAFLVARGKCCGSGCAKCPW